jgi:Flp pilus assembly protein protease CpaA
MINEIVFLLALALVWVLFATIQDLRKREIADWISFSLIIFAIGFRFFYSFFTDVGFGFFYQGLIWLAIFFVVHNVLYWSKFFAGGDAKLFFALGAVLPFYGVFALNLKIFVVFFFTFLFVGAAYTLIASFILGLRNPKKLKKELVKQTKINKKLISPVLIVGLAFMLIGINQIHLFIIGVLIFFLPWIYVYTKSVDESCMVKKVKTSQLTEGDWLYKDVKIGKKIIKAKWCGVDKKEINQLKKKLKTVWIRYGVPFSPVFLISLLILIYFLKTGLWNSFW